MSSKKQLAVNFLAQILFSVINLTISFFLVPHIVKSLNASAYAFINLSNDIVNYATLITVALNSIAGRYITLEIHKKKYKEANIYYNSVLIANIIMSLVLLVPMLLFIIFIDSFLDVPTNIVGDVRLLFLIVFVNFIMSLITSVFSSTTFITNKLYLSSIASIFSQIARCLVLLLLFGLFKTNVWFVGAASFASTLVIAISNYVFTRKLLPELKIDFKQFNMKYTMEMLKNGVWNSVSRLSGILQTGLDLLLSNIFIGAVAMGIISLPRTITSIVFSLFGSISSIFNPNIMQAYAKNDYESIKRQLIFAIKFTGTISNAFIAVFITMGLHFYNLWVPTEDCGFLYFLSVISMISFVITLPLEPVYCVHTSANKIKQPALVALGLSILTVAIVLIGVMLIDDDHIKLLLIYGTSTITGLLKNIIYLPVYTAKIIDEKWSLLYPSMLKNVLIVICTSALGLVLKNFMWHSSWILFFITCMILGLLFLYINFMINFNNEEKKEFIKIFKKAKKMLN